MKAVFFLLSIVFCSDAMASDNSFCYLEKFLENTKEYNDYILSERSNEVDDEKNDLSLLPDIFIGINQSSSNDNSFKNIDNSSLSIGMTQQIYSGGVYWKTHEKIELNRKLNKSGMLERRNSILIDIYSDIIELEYNREQIAFYLKQLERQLNDIRRIDAAVVVGDVARIDSDIANVRIHKLRDYVNALKEEEDDLVEKIYIKYGITRKDIDNINFDSILACKRGNYRDNLLYNFKLQSELVRINNDITEATALPSVNFSVVFTPPRTGAINDFTTRRSDFGASVNVSLPMNQIFLKNKYQKQLSIDLDKIKLNYDNAVRDNIMEIRTTKRKINALENSIKTIKKSLMVEKNKVEYISSRVRQGQDSVVSYYQQLETYESIQINLKKEEKDLVLQKLYLHFIA